jgi:hypothetical protein
MVMKTAANSEEEVSMVDLGLQREMNDQIRVVVRGCFADVIKVDDRPA